jgi:sulfide:quinone oxidoreductase
VRAEAVPGAITLWEPGTESDELLRRLDGGGLVLALPPGPVWHLPLYELALHAARRDIAVTVVTAEARPLDLFGSAAADAVAQVLARAGIEVRTHTVAHSFEDGGVRYTTVPIDGAGPPQAGRDGAGSLPASAVLAAPVLRGPRIPGLPADAGGFVPVDSLRAVVGCPGVYAAGDVTIGAVKQGGLAAQQADVAAAAIAVAAGAPVRPMSYRPVLRGLLLTGGEPLYLRSDPADGSRASHQALWWPPVKFAGRHLASFLVSGGLFQEPLVDR